MITITVSNKRNSFDLPFWRLRIKPTPSDHIRECYIDSELGMEAITYTMDSGATDSVHLDAFLDFNHDPDKLRKSCLYNYTYQAKEFINDHEVSISEIAKMMDSSRSQVYRLLSTTNYAKSVDSMLNLLEVLGLTPVQNAKGKKKVA